MHSIIYEYQNTLHNLNIYVHVYKYIAFNLNLFVYNMSVGAYVQWDIYES